MNNTINPDWVNNDIAIVGGGAPEIKASGGTKALQLIRFYWDHEPITVPADDVYWSVNDPHATVDRNGLVTTKGGPELIGEFVLVKAKDKTNGFTREQVLKIVE